MTASNVVRKLRHDRPSGRFSKSRGLSASVSFLSFPLLSALLLAPFFARSLTLVPLSLLLNRTEMLATQAKLRYELIAFIIFKIHCIYFIFYKVLTSAVLT